MEWEVRLIEGIQSYMGQGGLAFGKLFAFLGGEMGLLLAVLLVMFCWKKEAGIRLALTLLSVNAWLPMLKSVVLRPRPYMEHPDRIKPLVPVTKGASPQDVAAQGYSFPSMHSASVPAAYFTIAREAKKSGLYVLAAALTFLVGFSRLAVGAHYPTDVLAGWALGFAVLWIHILLERNVPEEWKRHLIVLGVSLPGLLFVRTQDYYTALGLLIGVVAAVPFERRYVGYRDTRSMKARVLRLVGAFVIYFVVNTLLKLPFDKEYLASPVFGAFLIRMARYAIIMFLIMGVYPKAFPRFE